MILVPYQITTDSICKKVSGKDCYCHNNKTEEIAVHTLVF